MQRWLESMWQRHRWTALLITHDVREAVHLSDRIYLLSARPARIIREIAVPLPRPRTTGSDAARQAAALEAEILDTLLDPPTDQASFPHTIPRRSS
jgi:ABC-type nitrate/sulfonate/bicarbonate transport system ATPase subunit